MVDGFFPFDILRVQNHNNDIDIVSVAQIEIVGEREHTLEHLQPGMAKCHFFMPKWHYAAVNSTSYLQPSFIFYNKKNILSIFFYTNFLYQFIFKSL